MERFLHELLYKDELLSLFYNYSTLAKNIQVLQGDEGIMAFNELKNFFLEEQKQEISTDSIRESFSNFAFENISFYIFGSLLFSDFNSIFNPEKEKIYQVNYFI